MTLSHEDEILVWSGRTVPSIGSTTFTFALDLPDNLENFNGAGVNRFTLRQTPIASPAVVPEPASRSLLGLGLALAGVAALRNRSGARRSA